MMQSCSKTIKCAIWKDNLTGQIIQTVFDRSFPKLHVEVLYDGEFTMKTRDFETEISYSRTLLYTFSIKKQ